MSKPKKKVSVYTLEPTKKQAKEIKSVRAGPKNWKETVPLLLALIECGDSKGKNFARQEIARMAMVADLAREQEGA
jgi:hypothetical protein